MEQPTTIGIDLAKTVFQLHGVDAAARAILKRKLRRGQVLEVFARLDPCLVGMEACAGAHFWARELSALGHEVRIMPPSYVKPYVKRGKTDAADAEAICEAVTRPTMRFVPVKSAERQAALLDHKTRDFLVRQRTQLVNTIRAHLSEFGIVVAKGIHNVDRLLEAATELPAAARPAVDLLADQLRETQEKIDELTAGSRRLRGPTRSPDVWRRSRGRCHHGERDRGDDAGGRHLPLRPRLRRLARPHAAAAFQRRQGAAGPDLEGRQPVSAAAPLSRSDGADQREAVPPARGRLALAHAGEKAGESRRGRARQPDGAGRLGAYPDRRELPGQPGMTGHAGRLRPAPRR